MYGGCNADVWRNDSCARCLLDAIASFGLTLANIWPNRFAQKSLPALLDIVCVLDSSLVLHDDQFPIGGLLDHKLSSVAYNIELYLAGVNDKFHYLNSHVLQLFSKRVPNKMCWIENSKPRICESNNVGISVLWLAMHTTHDHDDDTSGRLVSTLSCCRCFETYIELETGKNNRRINGEVM
uniref:Uncharacterized protein n=1 Tax=Glossina austeni TaxID=7395 RepID=A0A1A9VFZ9_GLOAU